MSLAPVEHRGWKGLSGSVLAVAGVYVDERGCVHLPCRSRRGDVLRERIVAPDGRRWWGPGVGIHLFGVETLPSGPIVSSVAVLVCEGESDALAAREAFKHHEDDRAVSYIALGCPGASSWRPEWRALLEDFALVYAIGDGDDAGRRFVWSVRASLPWSRPVVCPEGRDLRELLQAGKFDLVVSLLAEADYLARLEDAVFHAPNLVAAEHWLGGRGVLDRAA